MSGASGTIHALPMVVGGERVSPILGSAPRGEPCKNPSVRGHLFAIYLIEFVTRVCMDGHVKTITLDDDAYDRLKSWKRRSGDSFSAVVKRVVPRAGTLEAMARFAQERISFPDGRDDVLESTVEKRPTTKHDPWT